MNANERSDWSFPKSDEDGWTFICSLPSEAMHSYRIADDDAAKLVEALGVTMADLHNSEAPAVRAWQRLTAGEGGEDRLADLGIAIKLYAVWIPGGDWGYHYDVAADGSRDYTGGNL